MPRNSFERKVSPGNLDVEIVRYENPTRRYRLDCDDRDVEFRDPGLVTAYFSYRLSEGPLGDPDVIPSAIGDVRNLTLSIDCTVAGCDPAGEENSDGGRYRIQLDIGRGTYVCLPASTLVARVSYAPTADDGNEPYQALWLVGWAGLGNKASYNGGANATITTYVSPNEDGNYVAISIPEFARSIVAIADIHGEQGNLSMEQETGPEGIVLVDTTCPITVGLAIPVVRGALSLKLHHTGGEEPPNVAVIFELAL